MSKVYETECTNIKALRWYCKSYENIKITDRNAGEINMGELCEDEGWSFEDCGMSGRFADCAWFVVKHPKGETNIYIKIS